MLIELLSRLPWLRQQAIIYISPHQLRAVDIHSSREVVRARKHSHPRCLIVDVAPLQEELHKLFTELFPREWVKCDVILCLSGCNDGGYTAIEKRAFREAAHAAGAKLAYLSSSSVDLERAQAVFNNQSLQPTSA